MTKATHKTKSSFSLKFQKVRVHDFQAKALWEELEAGDSS